MSTPKGALAFDWVLISILLEPAISNRQTVVRPPGRDGIRYLCSTGDYFEKRATRGKKEKTNLLGLLAGAFEQTSSVSVCQNRDINKATPWWCREVQLSCIGTCMTPSPALHSRTDLPIDTARPDTYLRTAAHRLVVVPFSIRTIPRRPLVRSPQSDRLAELGTNLSRCVSFLVAG